MGRASTGELRLIADTVQRELLRQLTGGRTMASVHLGQVEVFLGREFERYGWVVMVDGEPPCQAGADVDVSVAVMDAAQAAARVMLPRRAA